MKKIPLTQGKVALVDDEDYEYLNQWKWFAIKKNNVRSEYWYASRKYPNRKGNLGMHRVIMNTPHNMQVDHIDHNGLNNQRYNLRICNNAENGKNRTSYGRSKYLGVSYNRGFWKAGIRINNEWIYLGSYRLQSEAAFAYDIAAMKDHKEFANLNFKYADWFKKLLYQNHGNNSKNQMG